MPSAYLSGADFATYGLTTTTSSGSVIQASAMVDMFLKRPEGLIWTPDATGNPCFMAATTPSLTLTAPSSIAPGANVTVPVSGPLAAVSVGDTLILDRAHPTAMEAVTVQGITPGVSIIVRSVANAHSAGAALDAGMVITEQKSLPANRPITTLARSPIVRITSGTGRYGYGRRGDNGASQINDFNLLAAFSQFGGPPLWEVFDTSVANFDPRTGQTWIPAGVMLAYYTDVRVSYLAGFSAASLPAEIKMATAQLVSALADAPSLGAVRSYRAGDTQIERFADTMISGDVREMLLPYQARTWV